VQKRLPLPLRWARDGAIIALALSVVGLLLPSDWTWYNDWSNAHLVLHNLAAIATQVVVFSMVAATLGFLWTGAQGGRDRRRSSKHHRTASGAKPHR
jgi:hypothetical protein